MRVTSPCLLGKIIGRHRHASEKNAHKAPCAVVGQCINVPPLIRTRRIKLVASIMSIAKENLHGRHIVERAKDTTSRCRRFTPMPVMSDVLLVYNLVITSVLLSLLGITVWNLLRFPRLKPWAIEEKPWAIEEKRGAISHGAPTSVTIMVPARNEERCIEACVRSLCEQDYADLQVIVLDDGSTDATPQILARLAAAYPERLTVMQGTPLPDGWVGKSWACHNLAQQATGDVFIFTDADTVHGPHMTRAAVDMLEHGRYDMFSLVPYEEFGTFAEHAVIPMVHVLYFAYLPNDLIHRSTRVSVSAANGQFMCFRREGYQHCGGHAAVHDSMVEDVFLAKQAKRSGLRIGLVDGVDHVSCRMYTSARDVIHGFSKNFFPATSYNLPLTIVFILHLLLLYTLPLGLVIWGVVRGEGWMLPAAQLGIAGAIRLAIAARFRMPAWHALLQPITAVMAAFIGINSIRWAYSRTGPQWKGRSYATNRR